MKISKLVWKRGRDDKRPHYQTTPQWSATIISPVESAHKFLLKQLNAHFEKNIRFPHNIAHLIVEDGSQRRARQTRRTFTANCSQISFCNWGECIFFHCCLPAKIVLFWISLVSQFCTPEVNCRNNSSTKELYSLCPLNILNNNSRSANYIATYKVQTSKWNYLPY